MSRWLLCIGTAALLGCARPESPASGSAAPTAEQPAAAAPVSGTPAPAPVPSGGALSAVPAETLATLLPTTLPEVREIFPATFGRRVREPEGAITTATREFRFSNGGYLWLSVSDLAEVPTELQQEQRHLQAPGKDYPAQVLEFVRLPSGSGYVLWDQTTRNGKLRALLYGRFLIHGEGGRLPQALSWARLLDYLPQERYSRFARSLNNP
jgi:hypothetical protein